MHAADDPIAMVESLDPEALRAEMRDLEARRDSLRVLLRAANARNRRKPVARPDSLGGREASHAV